MIPEVDIVNYIGYRADGFIVSQYSCPAEFFDLQGPNENEAGLLIIVDDLDPSGFYVDTNTLQLVPKQPIQPVLDKPTVVADGLDVATVSGLPIPCGVEVLDGVQVVEAVVDDGSLEITFDTPGTYRIILHSAPAYEHAEVQIDAS